MKIFSTLLLLFFGLSSFAQIASLRGQLQHADGEAVLYANIALYHAADSTLFKVETSDENGHFIFNEVLPGNYYLVATYVGSADLNKSDISLQEALETDLGVLTFSAAAIELAEATVTASRALVEIKPDRTVFNVEGTINSAGSDALSLLRKAPGVTVDNNDNINVLGRSGVLLYVDGKRLPLSGEDLSNYLQNLTADQIDRIDIITNPGAKYEAEGNAGIIDIHLKKDKNLGANGSVNGTYSKGRYARQNIGASGNFRNRILNAFASAGLNSGTGFHNMEFLSYQNGLILNESNTSSHRSENYDYRLGTDFFVAQKHTLGFIVGVRNGASTRPGVNRIEISDQNTPTLIDSILVAENESTGNRAQQTFNLNYRFDNGKGRSVNVDADYGRYRNENELYQPNYYYDASGENILTEIVNNFDTPSDIDIYTLKIDYEEDLLGGKLGIGTKLSRVYSDNTFLVYDVWNEVPTQNDTLSNRFEYEENVYAGYINYARPLGEKWNFSAGLRVEQTDATGDLQAFLPELQEPPVVLNYRNWFPSAGLTWQVAQLHSLSLNYGRRINRPDYDVLNPFNSQLSQLSYRKGNPFLRPEIVNNLELGYTLAYRYNFKLAYSRTTDQITRLIGPDENDPRASFITWENLASQTIVSLNVSAPIEITKGWNAYFNINASYLDNQADYGNGAVVDLQAFTYNLFSQQTFDLPAGFKGEISGYYSGPGIWGGVFKYNANWSLDLGLQRKFLADRLNARLSVNDIFYESGWDGVSEFNGLVSYGSGRWDSRRVSLSLGYNFGNQNVKSLKRKTGLEAEAGRVGGGN
ncbi:MAG: TonB-dependent receptor [Saprospirales bacterium]|nr:TonB-dependent receptor [Saprospirales bacterium]